MSPRPTKTSRPRNRRVPSEDALAPLPRPVVEWKAWYGPAILAVLVVAMFVDVVADTHRVISLAGTDVASQFIGWRQFGFGELARGHLPLWNPHLFSGAPYVGGFQSAMFYPPNLLHLLLPIAPAINVLIAVHIYVMGVCTYGWARHRQLHGMAATVAGALVMFGGAAFLHVYAGHLPNLYTMTWAPLLLWSIDASFERPSLGWLLVGMAAVALQVFAGHPQYVFYTGIAAGLYWGVRAVSSSARWRALGTVAAMYAGGAAISTVQLWTGLAATAESIRSKPTPLSFASMFSFPPENLLTTIVPGVFGDMVTQAYWGRWYLWETSLFTGVTGAMLAVYGACCGERRLRIGSLVAAVVLFILALGAYTPIFSLLYTYAPAFGRFRGTAKLGVLVMLFVGLLSAAGLDALIRRPSSNRLVIGGGALAAILIAAGLMALSASSDPVPAWWTSLIAHAHEGGQSFADAGMTSDRAFAADAAWHAAIGLFIAAATAVVASGLFYWQRRASWPVYGIVLLAVLEVFTYARLSRPTFDPAAAGNPQVEQFLASNPGDYRVLDLATPNHAMTAGFADIWGYDPGVPLRYAEFMTFTQGGDPDAATQYLSFQQTNPLYRLLRLTYLFVPGPGQVGVVPIAAPMGHLALVYDYSVLPSRDAIFAAMDRSGFDPSHTAILESPPDLPALHAPVTDESAQVRITDRSTDSLTIQADLTSPALLVVTDGYSKDWRVRALPGSARDSYTVQPADYVVMAVPLSAGHHLFRLEYAPVSYTIGRWVSLGSLIVFACLAASWGVGVRRRRLGSTI